MSNPNNVRNRTTDTTATNTAPYIGINNNNSANTDYNNNIINNNINDPPPSGLRALPPASTFFAVILIGLNCFGSYLNVEEESHVYITYDKVIEKKEYWRLFCAHYFHFTKPSLFFSTITLLAHGYALEKKMINSWVIIFIIVVSGTLGNLAFIPINNYMCRGIPKAHLTCYGINNVSFILKGVYNICSELRNEITFNPTLILGFFPVYIPGSLGVWIPIVETLVIDLFINSKCFSNHLSALIGGFSFLILHTFFSEHVYVRRVRNPR